MKTVWTRIILAGGLGLALAGCSSEQTGDSAPTASTATSAATAGAPGAPAANAVALDATFGKGGISTVPLTASTHDRFMAVAVGADGKTYAAGFISEGGDQALAVARIDEKGALDKTFGKDGIASVNAAIGGKAVEIARSVVVQANGKIVIAGPIEANPAATGDAAKDTDIAVARFDAAGKIDTTFGKSGVTVIDFGAGRATSATTFVGDTSWGIGALSGDRVVLFGSKLADGAGRTDTDFVVFALTNAGVLDTAFGAAGKVVVDLDKSVDNPRHLLVQADGKVVATGYSSIGGVVSPVLIRMSSAGVLDNGFGRDGVANAQILPGVAESYSVSMQGDSYIIAGYGRGADATEKVDMVVERFTANGQWDKTFGTNGLFRLDIAKDDDRARNVQVLPDGRILVAGSGKKTATNIDAMLVLLSKDGVADKTFGDAGILISDLGGPADAWYGITLSADKKYAIVTGYKGTDATSGGNDDAVVARVAL